MKENIKQIIAEISKRIRTDILSSDLTMERFLKAYNRYQEDERDGVDYIFNINNKEDLRCVIDGGMTAQGISQMWQYYNDGKIIEYFLYGANHHGYETFDNLKTFKGCLAAYAEEVIECVIKYPWVDEYKVLYGEYITDMLNEEDD